MIDDFLNRLKKHSITYQWAQRKKVYKFSLKDSCSQKAKIPRNTTNVSIIDATSNHKIKVVTMIKPASNWKPVFLKLPQRLGIKFYHLPCDEPFFK